MMELKTLSSGQAEGGRWEGTQPGHQGTMMRNAHLQQDGRTGTKTSGVLSVNVGDGGLDCQAPVN